MGTPIRRADRIDRRGALRCDRPADFTVAGFQFVVEVVAYSAIGTGQEGASMKLVRAAPVASRYEPLSTS